MFNVDQFEPHIIHFLPDNLELAWFIIAGNALIALAYVLIPLGIIYIIRKRKDIIFQPIFILYAAFIFLCGLTHVAHIMFFGIPTTGFKLLLMQ